MVHIFNMIHRLFLCTVYTCLSQEPPPPCKVLLFGMIGYEEAGVRRNPRKKHLLGVAFFKERPLPPASANQLLTGGGPFEGFSSSSRLPELKHAGKETTRRQMISYDQYVPSLCPRPPQP